MDKNNKYIDFTYHFDTIYGCDFKAGLRITDKDNQTIVIATDLEEFENPIPISNWYECLANSLLEAKKLKYPENLILLEYNHQKDLLEYYTFKFNNGKFMNFNWEGVYNDLRN